MSQEQERQQREKNCHSLAKIFKKMPSVTHRTSWAEVSYVCTLYSNVWWEEINFICQLSNNTEQYTEN